MKKILITSTDMMMMQFLIPHVLYLREQGYDVDVACSEVGGRFQEIEEAIGADKLYRVRLVRNPFNPSNIKGLKDLKRIISGGNYDLVWTNEPVMGVMTRIAARKARKRGTKVMYMVHGFHFFIGAPKKNWILYYPIEKLMSSKTDVIVTINNEDYVRAKNLNCKSVEYIHGIGINTSRLSQNANVNSIREELGLSDGDFIIISIGELNQNKNQEVIINALGGLKDKTIHYLMCGKGTNREKLSERVEALGLNGNVHFLGYRKDVVDICSQSDVFVMPSKREGLPVATLEAMYCGLPLITSTCRGIVDVMENGITGFMYKFSDIDGFKEGILRLKNDSALRISMGEINRERVKPYCIESTKVEIVEVINKILE